MLDGYDPAKRLPSNGKHLAHAMPKARNDDQLPLALSAPAVCAFELSERRRFRKEFLTFSTCVAEDGVATAPSSDTGALRPMERRLIRNVFFFNASGDASPDSKGAELPLTSPICSSLIQSRGTRPSVEEIACLFAVDGCAFAVLSTSVLVAGAPAA